MTFYDDIYPFYPRQRTPFIFSGPLLAVILVFLVLAVSFLLILPGIRGHSYPKELNQGQQDLVIYPWRRFASQLRGETSPRRLLWMFRIMISSFIGAVIVAINFTCDWAEARTTANATYKSFSNAVVNAEIGLHVGLYGINVTLRGNPVMQYNETIDYNEMFSWQDSIEKDYEEALEKGLPNPILYIAEKFTLNSPCGLIFQYKYSGRYASATLWTAFCCWVVANILLSMPVILYAGYMMMATAAFIFFSVASFSTIMNLHPCIFSIGNGFFETEYSHSFWLAIATGALCAVIGILLVVFHCMTPEKVNEAFSVDLDSFEDEDMHYGEGYLNSVCFDGVTTAPSLSSSTIEHIS